MADFGARSLITHTIMAAAFVGAIVSGLFVEGRTGLISLVAFLNFAAGMWVSQSIHAVGNAATDSKYRGVVGEVLRRVR